MTHTDYVQLRRVAHIYNGGTPTSNEANWNGEIPWATPIDLGENDGKTIELTHRSLTLKGVRTGSTMVPSGSILLSTRAPIGYTALTKVDMAFNQGCKGLVLKNPVNDSRYLQYALQHIDSELNVSGQGATFIELSSTKLAEARVPMHSPITQRRIAGFLDRETAEIDAFIADLQEFRSTLFERRSARRDALIAGGRPVQEAGYTWLSEFEAIYTEGRMKNIFEITLGKMLDAKSHRDNETHYPYLRAANISEGTVDFGELNQMPFNARERERFSIKKGDMLVVEGGSVGENTVIEQDLEDIFFQKTINRARPKYGNDSYYFSQVLEAYLDREVFDVVCNKSTIMHLTAEKLGDLEVPIPRPDTQQAISRDLMNLDAEVRLAVSDVEMAIALATERRSALIAAAVTGQLDVSDRYAAEQVYEEVESKQ